MSPRKQSRHLLTSHSEKVRFAATSKSPGGSYRRAERSPKVRALRRRMARLMRERGMHVPSGKRSPRKPKEKK